jgi:hypothetical protein
MGITTFEWPQKQEELLSHSVVFDLLLRLRRALFQGKKTALISG